MTFVFTFVVFVLNDIEKLFSKLCQAPYMGQHLMKPNLSLEMGTIRITRIVEYLAIEFVKNLGVIDGLIFKSSTQKLQRNIYPTPGIKMQRYLLLKYINEIVFYKYIIYY